MKKGDRIGRRVRILGGMPEFIGQQGRIISFESGYYRVKLDKPVVIETIGPVTDDLWESRFLATIQ